VSGVRLFLQRLTAHLHSQNSAPYVINLDPAVHEVPFPANIGKVLPGSGSVSAESQTGQRGLS
ncbi:GPN-loop GTPase 1, partial [Xenoophorus captivus]